MTFDELCRRYEADVRHAVARRLDDAGLAEEAVQDTFLAVDLEKLDEIRNPSAWLATVATRKAIGTHRRHRVHHGRDVAMSPTDLRRAEESGQLRRASLSDDPAEALVAREHAARQRAAISAAMERLPPDQRRVLLAHVVDGLPYEVIASTTGETPNSLRQRVKRARRRFAGLYARAMDGEQLIMLGSLRRGMSRARARARLAVQRLGRPLDAFAPAVAATFERDAMAACLAINAFLGMAPPKVAALPTPQSARPSRFAGAVTPSESVSPTAPLGVRQPSRVPGREHAAGPRPHQYVYFQTPTVGAVSAAEGQVVRPRDDDASPALYVGVTVAGQPIEYREEDDGLRCDSDEPVRPTLCTGVTSLNNVTDRR